MSGADWEPVAFVTRSKLHHGTWVGAVWDASFSVADTPAGPLRLVRGAVLDMAIDDPDVVRWRWRHVGDNWVLETRPVGGAQ